ncbi:MAG: hypothetical protein K2K95_00345, partial [Muribaculaceae bacterium]|nr:hypothetical protein [Muribaculaceae bacterium]
METNYKNEAINAAKASLADAKVAAQAEVDNLKQEAAQTQEQVNQDADSFKAVIGHEVQMDWESAPSTVF